METFSALLAICAGNSPVPGEFPAQRPVTRSFDVFFDLRLNKWLSKQSWGWWFETLSLPLWCHRNVNIFSVFSDRGRPFQLEIDFYPYTRDTLQWRHNGRGSVSSHQPRDCLLNRLFRRRSKKTSKLCVTGLCAVNSPVTGEFPAQRAVTRKMFPLMTSSWDRADIQLRHVFPF